MISLVKTLVVCFATVFVLCLTVNGKPIFDSVYSVLSHVTVPVQAAAMSVFSGAVDSTQEYSKKIFNNSVPKMKDAVKSRASAPKRTDAGAPSEVIHVEEKEELDDLIKSHY